MTNPGHATDNRAAKARQALELRSRGLLEREIADIMGISRSYASALIHDPTGTKDRARKNSYRQPCPNCGRLMDGSSGRNGGGPTHCAECAPLFATVWTRERVVAAIQDFADQYGHPPGAMEWNPQMAIASYRDDLAERFYADDCWPNTSTVMAKFGSWNAGIRAAGFTPMRAGHKRSDVLTDADFPVIAVRYRAGESTYDIAKTYGVTNGAIAKALDRFGCPRRSLSEAQRLAHAKRRAAA